MFHQHAFPLLADARRAAQRISVFRHVLADELAQSLLHVLELIGLGGMGGTTSADEIFAAYARLFRLLGDHAAKKVAGRSAGVADPWKDYLLERILTDDNAFSRLAEQGPRARIGSALAAAVAHDLASLQALFRLDPESLRDAAIHAAGEEENAAQWPQWGEWELMGAVAGAVVGAGEVSAGSGVEGPDLQRMGMKHQMLAWGDWSRRVGDLAAYYAQAGAGVFGRAWAFRWTRRLEEIDFPDPIRLEDLIGYEAERAQVVRNTERFVQGFPANNLLLYGDRGTGKSATVKALLHRFGPRGLRLIELPKRHLAAFPRLLGLLRHRPQRFVVFVDDLSFEEDEISYKELKSVLEGGVEARPENVLVYATSNRRHLVTERCADRRDEVRAQDTLQEKLSLADRFGVTVIFLAPDQDQYLAIVEGLARQHGLELDRDELRRRALLWERQNNPRSARTARQFVNDLLGAANQSC